MTRKFSIIFRCLLASLVMLPAIYTSALASGPSYGGWQTNGNWSGVDGYIRQSGTVHVTSGLHAAWINLCRHNSCDQWVQTGTIQGYFAGGNSPDAPHIFYENVDACGVYHGDELGIAPSTPNYPYYIKYDGAGKKSFTCPNGVPGIGYGYEYRKGSSGSQPFYRGILSTIDGLAFAKTEVQGGAPMNADYFGCTNNQFCSNSTYGMHLYTATGGRLLWTTASTPSNANPPYLRTYNNYWSFRACSSPC